MRHPSGRLRTLLELRFWRGCSIKELAGRMGLSAREPCGCSSRPCEAQPRWAWVLERRGNKLPGWHCVKAQSAVFGLGGALRQ